MRGIQNPAGYLKKLEQGLKYTYHLAAEHASKQEARNKEAYVRKAGASKLEVTIVF